MGCQDKSGPAKIHEVILVIKEDSYSNHPRGDGIDCVPPKIGFCLTIFISNLLPPMLYL